MNEYHQSCLFRVVEKPDEITGQSVEENGRKLLQTYVRTGDEPATQISGEGNYRKSNVLKEVLHNTLFAFGIPMSYIAAAECLGGAGLLSNHASSLLTCESATGDVSSALSGLRNCLDPSDVLLP
jgi:hypothetical protein